MTTPDKCPDCGMIHLKKGYCPAKGQTVRPVAQRTERKAPDLEVAGSSPAGAANDYERVKLWREANPIKYRAYQRSLMRKRRKEGK